MSTDQPPELAELSPKLPPATIDDAKANLERYLAIAIRIHERLVGDPIAGARFTALTESGRPPTMKGERSNQTNKKRE